MTTQKTCPVCGSEKMKTGKLFGVASIQSPNARSALGGSELNVVFCADCGEVIGIKVANPEKVK